MAANIVNANVVKPERGRLHEAIEMLAAEIAALAATDLVANPRALVRIEKLTKIITALRAEAFTHVHMISDEESYAARGEPAFVCGADDMLLGNELQMEYGPNPLRARPYPIRMARPLNPIPGWDASERDEALADIDAKEARRMLDEQGKRKAELEELALIDHVLSNDKSAVAQRGRAELERRADAIISSIGAHDGPGDSHVVRADVVRGHSPEGDGEEPDPGGDLQAHPF